MIKDYRRVDQWQKVSNIEIGPGQYSPFSSNVGGKYNIG